MMRNALAAVPDDALRHVALVSGLKHYLGSFEDFAKRPIDTPLVNLSAALGSRRFVAKTSGTSPS